MFRFWTSVIEPVLRAAEPEAILEIGSERGQLTARLLEHAAPRGVVVHVIEPEPKFDVEAWRVQYGPSLELWRARSLDALSAVPEPDVALIDGDHNWYTVLNELRLIEDRAASSGRQPPVILLHDVEWPYGRRDLYYEPDTVPAEERQPFAYAGLRPDRSELVETGGLNAHLAHALHEGGPRNGVATAIDEFLEAAERDVDKVVIPGFHGLCILSPGPSTAVGRRLEPLIRHFESGSFLREHCRAIELSRNDGLLALTASGEERRRLRMEGKEAARTARRMEKRLAKQSS